MSNMLFMFLALNILFSSQKYGKTFTCASFRGESRNFSGEGGAYTLSEKRGVFVQKFTRRVKISTRRVEISKRRVDFPASPGRCRGHVERVASHASCEEAGSRTLRLSRKHRRRKGGGYRRGDPAAVILLLEFIKKEAVQLL